MDISPLEVLYDAAAGDVVGLPPALQSVYGRLVLPAESQRPHVLANFVETLDGVVSLSIPGKAGGGPISGSNQHDRLVMGLLRSVSDVVVVGAGTLRSVPHHIWTADHVYPRFARDFAALRTQRGRPAHPLNVIVTSSGDLNPGFAILDQSHVPVHVLTTAKGAAKIGASLRHVGRTVVADGETIRATDILRSLTYLGVGRLVLLESGPQLMGQFIAERAVDELFLTLSPQVAGRDDNSNRPGLVSRQRFAPHDPRWAELVSVRRGKSHLFLRYSFDYVRDNQGGQSEESN
jgi:riboflavin biosynthesis pyrimidine reductase